MQAWMLGFALGGMVFAEPAAPVAMAGKDLKPVPGPMVNPEYLRDLVSRMGNSDMDLMIRRSARRIGIVPALAVPAGNVAVTHRVSYPAGWQAFQVEAAPGEKIKARLRGEHEAWFVVRCVAKMGNLEKGMLQNLIQTGNPEASYRNFRKEARTVYFVVDTSEIVTSSEPFTITFTREGPAAPKVN